MEPKPTYKGKSAGKPQTTPITPMQAAVEVDVTPTGEGMQIAPTRPSHETAPHEQYSPQFEPERVVLAIGANYTKRVSNIPRSWAVKVNGNSAAGCLIQVRSGLCDVTLAVGDHILFPARSDNLRVDCFVGAGDVTIFAIGDDWLKL